MVASLSRDSLVRISIAAALLQAAALAVFAPGTRASMAGWSDAGLLGIVAFATLRLERTTGANERWFWRLVLTAASVWFLTSLTRLLPRGALSNESLYLVTDCLYLAVYSLFILALSLRPELPGTRGPLARAVILEWVGVVVFGVALLAYFVIVPFQVDKPSYVTLVPSMSAFVLLDGILVLRLGWLWRRTAFRRWRTVYGLFALSFVLTLAHDLHELHQYANGGPDSVGGPWDLVWTGQFVALIAAAAAARSGHPEAGPVARGRRPASGRGRVTPLLPFAFALPIVHLAGRVGGLIDPAAESAREILVLFATPVLGGLAIAHQALLERRHRHVRRDLLVTQGELQQSRKMEALGRLAGGVAHDFNNLLAVILGYADMLAQRAGDDDRLAGPVTEIREAADRALALTRQLTTFSQRRSAEAVAFNLDDAVSALAPVIKRLVGPRVVFTTEYRTGGRCIAADRHQFDRVLINLAANAREAMPGGGRLHLSTELLDWSEDDSRRPSSLPPGPYLRLAVTDSGAGMTPAVRSHAFEPFFTTKGEGDHQGLGLSVVYGIVMQAGGHIEVESQPGAGTTFRLTFPEAAPPVLSTPQAGEPAPPVSRHVRATVLLAEDDPAFRELMRAGLEHEGYLVLEAADGRAALDLAARHEGRIDLLVTDLLMPGVDGRRLAERLLPGRPEMRVLFVSGYAGDLLDGFTLPQAGRLLLRKPFTVDDLVRCVAEVIDSPGHPAAV